VGEVYGPINTETGHYIVRALKILPSRTIPFEEARQEIREQLHREQYDRLMQEYFADLIQRAVIRYDSEQFMSNAVDQAVQRYWVP